MLTETHRRNNNTCSLLEREHCPYVPWINKHCASVRWWRPGCCEYTIKHNLPANSLTQGLQGNFQFSFPCIHVTRLLAASALLPFWCRLQAENTSRSQNPNFQGRCEMLFLASGSLSTAFLFEE